MYGDHLSEAVNTSDHVDGADEPSHNAQSVPRSAGEQMVRRRETDLGLSLLS
jgi:hypothetical protein